MKLSLSSAVYSKAVASGKARSVLDVSARTHLHYDTVTKMTDGTFSPQMFECLSRYLTALGYTAKDLSGVPINEIFTIRD
jgi:hypothetical protein